MIQAPDDFKLTAVLVRCDHCRKEVRIGFDPKKEVDQKTLVQGTETHRNDLCEAIRRDTAPPSSTEA